MNDPVVFVIGAGLAGSEAAWQLAEAGIRVRLYEMKPLRKSPAHHSDNYAELVCSNSFRSDRIENAVGLLKEELRTMGSLIMSCADRTSVPAGGALAVDREDFSSLVTKSIKNHPLIETVSEEVCSIPSEGTVIIATGPLTDGEMAESIMSILGNSELHFFDAAAPIVMANSIDRSIAFPMSRYGKGGDDYLNCPMNEEEYRQFYDALVTAEMAEVANFDKETVFEGCMPIETMAKRGYDTIRFGPMKPVGLIDPRIGKEPYACVQLRQDDRLATMFNIVGFQTRLRIPEQQRVFRMIPGLRNAEFCRYGVMHRNTFINSPRILDSHYSLRNDSRIYFAGQITGVEGYVESVGSGFLSGIYAAAAIKKHPIENPLTDNTMIGAMAAYVSDPAVTKFQPMNANFGIIAPLGRKFKSKPEKNQMFAERSQEEISRFVPVISALREKGYN